MTRFARTYRKKSANIKASAEEATSWAEFQTQMKAKKETLRAEKRNLSEFPDPEHYYDKNTYISSWCDFEPNNEIKSKKNLKRINESEMVADKTEGLSGISKKEKKRYHQKCNVNKDEIIEVEEKHIQFCNDDILETIDKNSHIPFKSKKKTRLNTDEETPVDSGSEVKQVTNETRHCTIKNKKQKFQDIYALEGPKSSNKRKHQSDKDKDEGIMDDDVNKISARKENQFAGDNHGKKRKKGLRNEMTLFVDGKNVKMTKFDGFYILEIDAERIKKLRQKMIDEGRSQAEIEGIIRRHRRNAEKSAAKKKKKICFHCREGVHNLSQCPKLDGQSGPIGSSVCYKCGSTEHLLHQCKIPGNDLKFAKCFICNEVGHLSKQCPDNPRGLYPNGGSCRVCGDVTHLKRDCPELIRKKRKNTVTVGTIGDSIESLEDDRKPRSIKSSVHCKRVNKIIKFE